MNEDIVKEMDVSKLLDEIDQYCTENSIPNVDKEVGKLFSILIKASRARNILEIGTGVGYSTIWLSVAAGENQGKVLTIERDSGRAEAAGEYFRKAGLINVNILNGDALALLQNLDEKFDFVFIDAAKEEYIDYIKAIYAKLMKPSLIVADNAISHVEAVSDYLNYVRSDKNFTTVLIPIRAGLEVSYLS